MRVLDLFAGIGGFSLGLERVGFRTVAFCEIDPYCRAVLARHWPGVPIFGDIRELTAEAVADATRHVCSQQAQSGTKRERAGTSSQPIVDVICGGFPCQDISVAGKGVGLAGPRSSLWVEMARIVGEIRPNYVIVENVSALLGRGLGVVLGDLAALGYDAEWHCIPAAAVGAPHRRDRIWIVAYPSGNSVRQQSGRRDGPSWSGEAQPRVDGAPGSLAHSDSRGRESSRVAQYTNIQRSSGDLTYGCSAAGSGTRAHVADAQELAQREPTDQTNSESTRGRARDEPLDGGADVADPGSSRLAQRVLLTGVSEEMAGSPARQDASVGGNLGDTDSRGCQHSGREPTYTHARSTSAARGRHWDVEPDVGRVAHGVPARVDRLRALGNAIVPQIAEVIGEALAKKNPGG